MAGVISILVPDDRMGGAEGILKKIASYYLRKGRTVHVFFLKKPIGGLWLDVKDLPNCTLHYTHASSEKKGILPTMQNLRKVSRNHEIDITYSSHIHLIALVAVLKRFGLYKTKYLVTRELTMIFERFGGFRLRFFKFLYNISRKYVNLKIFQTTEMMESFNRNLSNASKYNSMVLHNPIDVVDLQQKADSFIPDQIRPYVVACGRLNHLKGFDQLIQVFGEIENQKFDLVIIGDGPEREKLKLQHQESPAKERIHMVGHQDNPIPYFKHAFGCILSSRMEGFPNVLLEMMSQNGRVVSTDCAGGIDQIPGLFHAQKDNPVSLKAAIEKMIASSDAEATQNFDLYTNYLANKSLENYVQEIEKSIHYQ